jgi:alanine racemase
MNNASVLEINKAAIKHNLSYFKSKLNKNTKIIAVVKANAYGTNAVIVSEILEKQKVDYLAVAYTNEGVELRKTGIKLPILVLHPQLNNLSKIISNDLEPNLYSQNILEKFIKLTEKNNLKNYPIHLNFNTGFNRLGFEEDEVEDVISFISENNSVTIKSVYTHLAASEDLSERTFTKKQINCFNTIKKQISNLLNYKPLYHVLNTSGILNYSEAQFDMVRLGIGIYGFANDLKETKKLKNVSNLKSVISQIYSLEKGESVGYSRVFKATGKMRIASIPIGYADGVSRLLSNGVGSVKINNKKAIIIGNISMDILMVDVTGINCIEGDCVILFDSQEMIEEMATQTNTISYEIIASISQRVKRVIV